MKKTENQASDASNTEIPANTVKPTLSLHDIFKCGDLKPQRDYVELVYYDNGYEVRVNRGDFERMSDELDEAQEMINQYQGHLSLCFNFHGQLAWDKITCHKSLGLADPHLNRKIKNALLKLYPSFPMQTRKYLFKAIKFHLNYLSGKHTWLDEFALENISNADF